MIATAQHQAGIIEGLRRQERAMQLIESYRPDWLLAARRTLLEVALAEGHASVDDVRDRVELPEGKTNLGRFFAPLVKSGALEVWRYVPSRRPENHARPIVMLKLASAELARQWLADHPAPLPPPPRKPEQRELFSTAQEKSD